MSSPRSLFVVLAVGCALGTVLAAEIALTSDKIATKDGPLRGTQPELVSGLDFSKLTPEQRRLLTFRMELLRRRRAEAASPSDSTAPLAQKGADDLEGANTYGFGAALPFLGLYGLGLGGLGVGLGPLAFGGLLG